MEQQNSEIMYDIIIIGGGPGGIGCAIEAAINGVDKILLIEKSDNHSSTIRKFYKDNKRVDKDWKGQVTKLEGNIDFFDGTKESTLDYFDSLLDTHRIDTSFHTEVESIVKHDHYFNVFTNNGLSRAKNVVVTIGRMGKPNKPSYKIPPSIKSLVNFNLDKADMNEKVLVVGGGNSAAEYAYELADRNNTVTLVYRKEKFTRLNPQNEEILYQFNGEEKLRLRMGTNIVSLANNHGRVLVEFDDGYCTIYDRVIYAIGGTAPVDFLKTCNIEINENGMPLYNESYETNIKGVYVAGDIAFNSGGSIAMAINHGYHIVADILRSR